MPEDSVTCEIRYEKWFPATFRRSFVEIFTSLLILQASKENIERAPLKTLTNVLALVILVLEIWCRQEKTPASNK